MNRVHQGWGAGTATGVGVDAEAAALGGEGAAIVEAVLSWRDARGDNVLARTEAALGVDVAIGEETGLLVPADVLGYERFEVVTYAGDRPVAVVPPGGKLRVDGWAREERQIELTAGHAVEVHVGAFVVKLSLGRAGTRLAGAPLEGLKRSGMGVVLGSALAHAAAFAVLAYVSPALGATEGDAYDTDRILLMQKLLDASAQHEIVHPPEEGAGESTEGGQTSAKPAEGAEGKAGKDTPNQDGKWAAKGTARPETATLPRESEKEIAANFGIIGLIATSQSSLDAPTVTWGTTLNGADDVNKVGNLFGSTINDAMGTGGWGLSGVGLGGGGSSQGIGIGDGFGGLGGTGSCVGGGPCNGIGVGRGRPGGGHVSKAHIAREAGPITTNGHLPADVIQRIVRQNAGRYRFCYEQGLRGNPTLTGRVTVKFLIGRDGGVGFAADGGSDLPDAGVRQCVVSSFTALSFPVPDSGVVTVMYPLMFSPE